MTIPKGPYNFDREPYNVNGPGGIEVYGDVMNDGLADLLNIAWREGYKAGMEAGEAKP